MNRLFHGDCLQVMPTLPEESVDMILTSPPYNVNKDYEDDIPNEEFLAWLKSVWTECHRLLKPNGRIAVNMNNKGKNPRSPLAFQTLADLMSIGFTYQTEHIWDKGATAGAKSAWGSWQSASCPTARDNHEFVFILSKGDLSRPPGKSTITRNEFLDFTNTVWQINTIKSSEREHCACFPKELPYRIIQLYTYEDDVVLDPFAGTGTTCVVAKECNRQYIGIEQDRDYHELANNNLENLNAIEEFFQ